MAIIDLRGLMLYEIAQAHHGEEQAIRLFQLMAADLTDRQAKDLFEQHGEATRVQLTNLDRCFAALGVEPRAVPCYALLGLLQQHQDMLGYQPTEAVWALFALRQADQAAQYQVALYRGLLEKAMLLREQECVQWLQQNLRHEEEMLEHAQHLARQRGQQLRQHPGAPPGQPIPPRQPEAPPG